MCFSAKAEVTSNTSPVIKYPMKLYDSVTLSWVFRMLPSLTFKQDRSLEKLAAGGTTVAALGMEYIILIGPR
jgi:hypothetical protein